MIVEQFTEDELDELIDGWRVHARPKQLPPPGAWRIWLLLAGRGFGKTIAITQWAIEQALLMPGSHGAIVAPTAADSRAVLVEGESGVLNVARRGFMPTYEPSKRLLTFPNGSRATLYSADEPNRLRGPQHHWAICDELAAWNYAAAFDMLLLGLRLGDNPRVAIATTPRPVPLIKRLLADPTAVIVRGSTYENRANLAPSFFAGIVDRYEGTALGRQEILGEIVDDDAGSLFKQSLIDAARVGIAAAPPLRRVVVAIDPAVTANHASDETGIIVAAVGADDHAYVLDDLSLKASPGAWAAEAVVAYEVWQADRIVAEVNNGGDLVEHTIRTVDANVSFTAVRAARGKIARAEPIAALYEQGKVHHVGTFSELEDQMTNANSVRTNVNAVHTSPDRVDALVWALTAVMLNPPADDAVIMRRARVRD